MSLNNVAMIIAPNLFLSSEAKTQPTINEMKQAQATVNIVRMLVKYQMILWTVRLVPFLVLPIFLPLAVRLRYVWLFLFFPLPCLFSFSSLSLLFPFSFPFFSRPSSPLPSPLLSCTTGEGGGGVHHLRYQHITFFLLFSFLFPFLFLFFFALLHLPSLPPPSSPLPLIRPSVATGVKRRL